MNILDIALILLALTYAISGYLRGFVASLCVAIGLVTGGGLGIIAIPWVIDRGTATVGTSAFAITVVIVMAVIGGFVGAAIGKGIRDEMERTKLSTVDSLGGAGLTAIATLVIAWAVGYGATVAQVPFLSQQARDSAVLKTVDRALPSQSEAVVRAFTDLLDTSFFPRYLDPFGTENIVVVDPPDPAILDEAAVQEARTRVAKITGLATPCQRGVEGSGFVYADNRIMTNAHVVAGVTDPTVGIGGTRFSARVVVFNPDLDVAVLAVEGLNLAPLAFDESGAPGDSAAIMGFPANGPFDERPARVRSEERLRGPDIYNRGEVQRDTFAIRSLVRPGNSGGPLIGSDGRVIGVIFAASLRDPETGYALTATQVQGDAQAGIDATAAVATGDCA